MGVKINFGKKHDRLRKKGKKLEAKSDKIYDSTRGKSGEGMSQKKLERKRKRSRKVYGRAQKKFEKASDIRNTFGRTTPSMRKGGQLSQYD